MTKMGLRSKAAQRVDWKRTALFERGVRHLVKEGDIIMVGDVDEIASRDAVQMLKECQGPKRGTFLTHMFIYGFDNCEGTQWNNPKFIEYNGQSDWELSQLRYNEQLEDEEPIIDNGGWHCSWCFPHIEDIRDKMLRYSHHD